MNALDLVSMPYEFVGIGEHKGFMGPIPTKNTLMVYGGSVEVLMGSLGFEKPWLFWQKPTPVPKDEMLEALNRLFTSEIMPYLSRPIPARVDRKGVHAQQRHLLSWMSMIVDATRKKAHSYSWEPCQEK